MDIIGRRRWYFAFSGLLVVFAGLSLGLFGLNLGIDFTSGSIMNVGFARAVEPGEVQAVLAAAGIGEATVQTAESNTVLIRAGGIDSENKPDILAQLRDRFGTVEELSFNSVGPVIGRELTRKALLAVGVASLAILLYLTWSFRRVEKPFRYGVTAVVALVHDALTLIGAFSILGKFAGVQVDSLFVTAVLTVVGFSVHDTIVVFDRIRENRSRHRERPFPDVVNFSLNQTLDRSLNTSLTAIFVLAALFTLGGSTIREFVLALLIGIVVGTYSSIFTASCLLVAWERGELGRALRLPLRLLRAAR